MRCQSKLPAPGLHMHGFRLLFQFSIQYGSNHLQHANQKKKKFRMARVLQCTNRTILPHGLVLSFDTHQSCSNVIVSKSSSSDKKILGWNKGRCLVMGFLACPYGRGPSNKDRSPEPGPPSHIFHDYCMILCSQTLTRWKTPNFGFTTEFPIWFLLPDCFCL